MSHRELCERARVWLMRNKYSVAFDELRGTVAFQHPDAIGWDCYGRSCLIEVKVSRSDFRRDGKKHHVEYPRAGAFRYYLVPDGLIQESELPEGWGLLVWDGRRIVKRIDAPPSDARCVNTECALLSYAMRYRRDEIPLQYVRGRAND